MKNHQQKATSDQNRQKAVSLCLILAIIFAGFAAEYAHQHINGIGELAFSPSGAADASLNSSKHGFTCQACQFSLTHIAPLLSGFTLKPIKESFRLCFNESSFYFVFHPTHYYLRAPPALFPLS